MSEEGEVTEEAQNFVVSGKEAKTTAIYGERIMELVGSPKEEVKLNTPVPDPYIIYSSSSSHTSFPKLSNPAAKEAK